MSIETLYWSYEMFRDKMQRERDVIISDDPEAFITNVEFKEYMNDAIDQAEQSIHALYEDYFLARATLTFTQGQEELDLPEGIYAHKIRRFLYRNGTERYTISRMRDWKKFEEYELNDGFNDGALHQYFLLNNTVPKILIVPAPTVTGNFGKIWYIRQANRIINDTDLCDIPESNKFIMAYLRLKIMEKDRDPLLSKAAADLAEERKFLEDTLASMVPDTDNTIEADTSHYTEMS